MKKYYINGVNGSIEVNNKYLLIILNDELKNNEEHLVWFEEIENVSYKKPKKDKYGYINIYLLTKNYLINKKISYSIILDRVNDLDLDNSIKLYLFIKNILDNKKVEIKEIIEKKEEDNEEKETTREINEDIIKEEVKEILTSKKITNEKDNSISIINNQLITKNEKIEEKENIEHLDNQIEKSLIDEKKAEEPKTENIIKEEIIINDFDNYIEFEDEDELNEEYKEEIIEDTINSNSISEKKENIKSIELLEKKIYELEKQIKGLSLKVIILNNYIDEANDKNKIDKMMIELNKLIDKLNKIKKEFSKHESILNSNDFIKIQNGNVVITQYGRLLKNENRNNLENYITEYQKSVKKYDEIKKETDNLSKNSDKKKTDINLSDKEYEDLINNFKNVKSNKEFINQYIKESKDSLKKVKWEIEKTVNHVKKYKYVKKEISKQTKMLASMTALNSIRPKHSRLSMIALSLFTGVSTIHDLLGYDIKKVEYNEIIQKEMLVGLDSIDTSKARFLINNSKDQIDKILYDCEKKYGLYPKYNSLRKNLIGLKNDIEKADIELSMIEDKVFEYNMEQKVKILKYKQE